MSRKPPKPSLSFSPFSSLDGEPAPTTATATTGTNTTSLTSPTSFPSPVSPPFSYQEEEEEKEKEVHPSGSHHHFPAFLTDTLPLPRLIVFDLDYTLWPFWADFHPRAPLKPAPATADGAAAVDRRGERFAFYPEVPHILHCLATAPHLAAGRPHPERPRLAVASKSADAPVCRDLLRMLKVASPPPPVSSLPSTTAGVGAGNFDNNDNDKSKNKNKNKNKSKSENKNKNNANKAGITEITTTINTSPSTAISSTAAAAHNMLSTAPPRRAADVFDAGLEIYPTSKLQHFGALAQRTGVAYEDMLFFDDEPPNREVERRLGVTMRLVGDGLGWRELDEGVREWRARRAASHINM